MQVTVPLSQILLPSTLPPLVHRLLDDWRGFYNYCKTRRLSISLLEEDHHRLRALVDSFYAAFREHPLVKFDEGQYRLRNSVIVQGNERSILFPYDLFIHESHVNVLPQMVDRLRNSPDLGDERVFIDRLALVFYRIQIILKKNDVRVINLLADPAFLQSIGYLFPTETQVARQLGITEATAEMRLRRLLDVQALQLKYLAHPSAFGCVLKLIEHPWPCEEEWRTDSLYSVEYAPGRGVSCIVVPSNGVTPHEAELVSNVKTIEFSWNLAQLDQWNKPSWEVRTQLTGLREQEVPVHSVVIELDETPAKRLSREDVEAIALLQATQGIDPTLLETHYGLSSQDAREKLNMLVREKQCVPMSYFLHIGLENQLFVYYKGQSHQLLAMCQNLREFPQAELMIAEDSLLAVIGLPKPWCFGVQQDIEELKTEGHEIHYRVASRTTVIDPWKRATELWTKTSE